MRNKKQKLTLIVFIVVLAGLPTAFRAETGELSVSVHEHDVTIHYCPALINTGAR